MDAGVYWLIGLVGLFVGVAAVRGARDWLTDRRQPEIVCTARFDSVERRSDQGTGWEPAERFVAVFVDDAGVRREFEISEQDASKWVPGVYGTLCTRGRLLRRFAPDA